MRADYTSGDWQRKVAIFKRTKKHHNLTTTELIKIYRVGNFTITQHFYPAIGRKNRDEIEAERRDYMLSHPMFGEEGERAPINNREFALLMHKERPDLFPKKSPSATSHLRLKCGILASKMCLERSMADGARYQLSAMDKQIQKLCKLTHGWGRPKGMDAHLESLSER
jgi:hypothetical protein